MQKTLCASAWISGFEKATKCRRCGKVRGEYFQPVFLLPTKYVLQMPGVIFNFIPARAFIPYRSRTIICCPAPQTYRGRKFGFRTLSQRRHLATVLQVAYARTNTMFDACKKATLFVQGGPESKRSVRPTATRDRSGSVSGR